MDAGSTDPIKTDFDTNPPITVNEYDNSIRLFCAAYEPLFVMAYAALRSMLSEDASLLIVGAGTGMELCEFGKRSSGWRMLGVDPSKDMLSIARDNLEVNGLSDRVTLFQGFMRDLQETDPFDAATCILVMHFLPDDGAKLSLLRSIAKRLKPGAPLVLVDGVGQVGSEEFIKTLAAWKQFPIAMGVDPQFVEEAFNGQILKKIQFVPEERILALLDEAGFANPSRFFTSFLYGGWLAVKK